MGSSSYADGPSNPRLKHLKRTRHPKDMPMTEAEVANIEAIKTYLAALA
jgi:hypothetical protein